MPRSAPDARLASGDHPLAGFLAELVARVTAVLSDDLVAIYAVGSLATGDARPATSDVDVITVAARPLAGGRRERLAATVVDHAAACPWAGLELVVYTAAAVAAPAYPVAYELNVNAGGSRELLVRSTGDPPHWFLLDLAMARDSAIPLVGPPAGQVIGQPSRGDVVRALDDSRRVHADHDAGSPDAVLNACRARCWVSTGRWLSKTEAGVWALRADGGDAERVRQALAVRAAGVR